jgi:hypothetical protein
MQVASFAVAALYSGMWFLRWARAGAEERMWPLLGWFCGTICAGSVAGAVAWVLQMKSNTFFYEANAESASPLQHLTLNASSFRNFAAFLLLYALEFLFLSISKLAMLGRLTDNAAQSSQADAVEMRSVKRKYLSGRGLQTIYKLMAGAVLLGSAVGVVANAVSASYYVQNARLYDAAAAACDAAGNNTDTSLQLAREGRAFNAKASTGISVQAVSEALTLLLVTLSFLVIVSWCVALFRVAEGVAANALLAASRRTDMQRAGQRMSAIVEDTMHAAAEQRRRLTAACVTILITFPVRAAFDFMYAYSEINNSGRNPACGICDACQTRQVFVNVWLNYTPEFQAVVVAVSSPLPLTLSLWLLTKAHARARLITTKVQRAVLGNGV